MNETQASILAELIQTVHRLRAPGGCPWDGAQTHQSIRPYLIEEAYEVLDILDQIAKQEEVKTEPVRTHLKEELGDLLMQVLLHSEMADEMNAFNFYDVAQFLNEKLVRRHPHVFGDAKAHTEELAFQRWEKEKAKEKSGTQPDASILDGVPRGLPALQRAARVIEKVTKVGFQWSDLQGPVEKLEEELAELKTEILEFEKNREKHKDDQTGDQAKKHVESELGDLFFSLCNVAYLLKISPENALRSTLSKFERRFRHVESRLKDQGKNPEESSLPEMDQLWNESKQLEKTQVWGLTGGIASGKSAVGLFLHNLNIPVIDADQISRQLMETNFEVIDAIKKRFGSLDRNQLRDLIFSDASARKDLEQILHPYIRKESRKKILELAPRHKVIAYEATLLIETGRYKELHGTIVVTAPESLRIKRLVARNQFSQQLAEKILHSQWTDEQKKPFATVIIENSGTLKELEEKVLSVAKQNHWV